MEKLYRVLKWPVSAITLSKTERKVKVINKRVKHINFFRAEIICAGNIAYRERLLQVRRLGFLATTYGYRYYLLVPVVIR